MNHSFFRKAGAMLAVGLVLTSCIDENYDLANLDTNSQFKVNNLILPVNIDDVSMKSIMAIDDKNGILQIVDGEYCFMKAGDFETSKIKIAPVQLKCGNISDINVEFPLGDIKALLDIQDEITLPIVCEPSSFKLQTSGVPASIVSIEQVGCDMRITIKMGLSGLDNYLSGFSLHGATADSPFQLQLPKGLKDVKNESGEGSYNSSTGLFSIPAKWWSGNEAEIVISVGAINFKDAGVVYKDAAITLAGSLGIDKSASITLKSADLKKMSSLPASITYYSKFGIDALNLTSFTGEINYSMADVKVPGLSLSGLPEILKQQGTDIKLENPQIYLKLNNPVYNYNLKVQGNLSIDAVTNGSVVGSYPMDDPIQIQPLQQKDYMLAPYPEKVTFYAPGYSDPIKQTYSLLGDVLSGSSLPQQLNIKLSNIDIPTQKVTDFKIGTEMETAFGGDYCFFAPLQFAEGAKVKYVGESKGWWGDDIENINISSLAVRATVSTDVPISLTLKVDPLNTDGVTIPGVTVNEITIPANAKDYEVEIKTNGDIKNLDGVIYEAVAAATEDASALKENMTITLKNIKAVISGTYTTSFSED